MRKLFTKYKRIILLLLIIPGTAGGILFLPISLESKYSCLYEKMFSGNHYVHNVDCTAAHRISECETIELSNNKHHALNGSGHDLLNTYLANYAFLWWGSLALVVFCFYRLHLINRKRKILQFPLEEKIR